MNIREPDHLNLLCDMGELTSIVTADSDIETFLTRTTGLVAKHLKAHVCSIYLYEAGNLVLKATQGLNPAAVNQVRMKPGEGLVGKCYSQGQIIREGNVRTSPGFKYFDNAGEEPFNSLLCIPIRRGVAKIGVLVVQHRQIDHFTPFDERALKTAVTQVAGAIDNASQLMGMGPDTDEDNPLESPLPQFVKGRSNSKGSAFGRIRIPATRQKSLLSDPDLSGTPYTQQDFRAALDKTITDLKALQEKFAANLPESAALIFTAHFMILKDKNFTGKMAQGVSQGRPAVPVIQEVARKYIQIFSASPHAHLREKAVDVEDLTIRLLSNLMAGTDLHPPVKGDIAVCQDLYPSDILKLAAQGILGIVLAGGGVTSHVTILARSLGVPMIISDDPILMALPQDTDLLLDADQGNIYINPDPETQALFQNRRAAKDRLLDHDMAAQTYTLDRERVHLRANINLLSEISLARELKAEGVGLYRTEFPFLIRSAFPSEDEQYLIYKSLFDQTGPQATTVRTLDTGGEKTLSYSGAPREANPVLGLRSIRFTLRYREIFETQIRAILRAAYARDKARIMFPLISSVDEFQAAKQVVLDCARDLALENIAHEHRMDIGMMVELPSVLATLDEFAGMADFFAIGTNDFIQYMVGADRGNELVADQYLPYHPAVCRGIEAIARAGQQHGIEVSVCGEMAHDPVYIPFFIGVGIRTLSVDPQFLPQAQKTIAAMTTAEARDYAARLLSATRVADAARVLKTCPGR